MFPAVNVAVKNIWSILQHYQVLVALSQKLLLKKSFVSGCETKLSGFNCFSFERSLSKAFWFHLKFQRLAWITRCDFFSPFFVLVWSSCVGESKDMPRVYMVALDIKNCFDRLDRDKLWRIIRGLFESVWSVMTAEKCFISLVSGRVYDSKTNCTCRETCRSRSYWCTKTISAHSFSSWSSGWQLSEHDSHRHIDATHNATLFEERGLSRSGFWQFAVVWWLIFLLDCAW